MNAMDTTSIIRTIDFFRPQPLSSSPFSASALKLQDYYLQTFSLSYEGSLKDVTLEDIINIRDFTRRLICRIEVSFDDFFWSE